MLVTQGSDFLAVSHALFLTPKRAAVIQGASKVLAMFFFLMVTWE